jgi:hypothetical protein
MCFSYLDCAHEKIERPISFSISLSIFNHSVFRWIMDLHFYIREIFVIEIGRKQVLVIELISGRQCFDMVVRVRSERVLNSRKI